MGDNVYTAVGLLSMLLQEKGKVRAEGLLFSLSYFFKTFIRKVRTVAETQTVHEER